MPIIVWYSFYKKKAKRLMIYDLNNIERKRAKILIVDDNSRDQEMVACLCNKIGYEVIVAGNGPDALDKAIHESPDLILMDVMLPLLDGFEATKMIRENEKTKHIPVIILTSLDARNDRIKGMEHGANDYISKPFNIKELTLRIKNNLIGKDYRDFLEGYNRRLEEEVEKRTEALNNALEQTKSSYIEAIQKLNEAVVYKDSKTGAHIKRLSLYCKELALALGMGNSFVEAIHYASPMHDLGKVGIPDAILRKHGKLTQNEWEVMKSHTIIGANILKDAKSPFMKMAEEIALSHHEKWNGSGYPYGLSGNEIPLTGRIVNIADQYDALRSSRPYKGCIDHSKATSIILKGCDRSKPGDYDPEILNAFRKIAARFEDIFTSAHSKGDIFNI
ncbi:MAG: response regulator [Deltaproteobacteria bacterium]|nr:response regulator [Deltaproteobacteria bacterium]